MQQTNWRLCLLSTCSELRFPTVGCVQFPFISIQLALVLECTISHQELRWKKLTKPAVDTVFVAQKYHAFWLHMPNLSFFHSEDALWHFDGAKSYVSSFPQISPWNSWQRPSSDQTAPYWLWPQAHTGIALQKRYRIILCSGGPHVMRWSYEWHWSVRDPNSTSIKPFLLVQHLQSKRKKILFSQAVNRAPMFLFQEKQKFLGWQCFTREELDTYSQN